MKIVKKSKTNQRDQSIKSTSERLLESMTAKDRQKHEEDYKELVLSELLFAIMEQDDTSVRKLAKLAGVSPTIIQSMRSGEKKDYSLTIFFKVLKGLGFKQLKIGKPGKSINIPIPSFNKAK